jgi:hypothetical protein
MRMAQTSKEEWSRICTTAGKHSYSREYNCECC